MDVKIVFLDGMIEDKVYINLPTGFDTHVYNSKKDPYKVRQAPQAWYSNINIVVGSNVTTLPVN